MEFQTVDLRPAKTIFVENRRTIILYAVAFAVLLGIYTFLIPAVWRAKTVLALPTMPSDPTALAMGSIPGLTGADPGTVLDGTLHSYPALTYIAQKNNMSVNDVTNQLASLPDSSHMQLTIWYDDANQKKGLAFVASALEVLGRLTADTDANRSAKQAKLYAQAVQEQEQALKDTEQQLMAFQNSSKTAPDPTSALSGMAWVRRLVDTQAQLKDTNKQLAIAKEEARRMAQGSADVPAALTASVKWREKLVDLEYQLHVAQTKFGPAAPEVVSIERAIDVTKNEMAREISNEMRSIEGNLDPKVADLEAKRLLFESQVKYLSDMAKIAPKEAMEFQRLAREAEARGEVLKELRQKYEFARIQADVESLQYSILAQPYIEPKPTNKSYVRNVLIGFFLGGLIGWGVLVWKDRRTVRRATRLVRVGGPA